MGKGSLREEDRGENGGEGPVNLSPLSPTASVDLEPALPHPQVQASETTTSWPGCRAKESVELLSLPPPPLAPG